MFLLFGLVAAADWYSTKGNKIVNSAGTTVRLSGLNWFGYETTNEVFHGLWAANLHDLVQQCATRKFNCWRVPFSVKVLQDWKGGAPNKKWGNNPMYNQDLEGLDNLQVFDLFLADAKKNNMKVFIDIHSVMPGSYMDNLWYTAAHPAEWLITALEWFVTRYKNDDTVIGIDIKNEPHGRCDKTDAAIWDDSSSPTNFKKFVETTSARLLAINPNLLMLVEGIECYKNTWGWWGGNLVPVKEHPINLGRYQNKLVYAPHEYGPSVNQQSWFHSGFSYDTLYKEHWKDMWMYIWEDGTAPLLIGEWGGHTTGDNLTWMKAIVQLIAKYGLSQTFWCLNPNSGDTGGLLQGDWKNWDETKYNIIKPVLVT